MSKTTERTIKCSACGAEINATIWDSINVTLSPNEKENVKNGSIFDVKCDKCSSHMFLEYQCMYHDMDKKIVVCSLQQNQIDEAIEYMSLFAKQGYTIRFVSTNNALIEKVRIFESGLKDTIIEYLKVNIAMEIDDENIIGYTYFDGISTNSNNQKQLDFVIYYNEPRHIGILMEAYDGFVDLFPDNIADCSTLDGVIVDAYSVFEWAKKNLLEE